MSYDYEQADELTQRVQKGHLVLAEEMAEVRRAAAVHRHDGRPRRKLEAEAAARAELDERVRQFHGSARSPPPEGVNTGQRRTISAAPLLEAEMRREMQPGRQIRPGRQMHSQIPSRMQSQTPSQIPSQVSSRATSSRLAERSGARGETNAGASRTPAPSRKPGTADSRVTFTPAGGTRDGAPRTMTGGVAGGDNHGMAALGVGPPSALLAHAQVRRRVYGFG